MPKGRLYLDATGADSISIEYKLIDASANSWWGELTLEDCRRIQDGVEGKYQFLRYIEESEGIQIKPPCAVL